MFNENKASDVAELFNYICGSKLKKVRVNLLSDGRKRNIRMRKKDLEKINMTYLDYFKKVVASDFLCGRNDRGWKADFDWLLKSANFIKVIEGNYDNRPSAGKLQTKPSYDLDEIKKRAFENTDI